MKNKKKQEEDSAQKNPRFSFRTIQIEIGTVDYIKKKRKKAKARTNKEDIAYVLI